MSTYDALLFDFDGVLADTEPAHYACWLATALPHGISFTWEYYVRNCVGVADNVLFSRLFKPGGPDSLLDLVAQKQAAFRAALEANPPFLSTTLALVRDLAARYPMAVVSSSARTEVEPPLVRAGIREYFQRVITLNDVENVKPSPEPYLKAAKLLGSVRPLVIEDSDSGVASATAAGFDIVRVSSAEEMPDRVRRALELDF